jgi:hypothetical protein
MKSRGRLAIGLLLAGLVLFSSGCLYVDVQRPLDTDFDNTQLGSKEGRSHSYSVLWLVAWGDSGTKAAAKQGNIQTIRHADYQLKMVLLGTYMRVTTIVYGD